MITIDQLVERHVIYCVSTLVSHISRQEPDRWSHLLYGYDQKAAINRLREQHDPMAENPCVSEIRVAVYNRGWENSEFEYEVYEHWIVTNWLAVQLAMRGEVVERDFHGLVIWGRGATGQRISLDSVIKDIHRQVEALAG